MRYRSGEARGGAERASEEEEHRGRGEPPHLNGERSRAGPSLPRAAEAIRRAAGGHPRSLWGCWRLGGAAGFGGARARHAGQVLGEMLPRVGRARRRKGREVGDGSLGQAGT